MITKKLSLFIVLLSLATPSFLYAGTEYGAAAVDWKVFDNDPAGASIKDVDAPLLGKSVVQTRGAGRTNSYLLGGVILFVSTPLVAGGFYTTIRAIKTNC